LLFDILCDLALAVASGSAVFLFKSLRPYYKFVLPQLEIAQVEKDVWLKAREVCDIYKSDRKITTNRFSVV
jgi:hypothetical protein